MDQIKKLKLKISSTVKKLPMSLFEEAKYELMEKAPKRGDVIVGEIKSVGWHNEMEGLGGEYIRLFESDLIITALGNRYATSEFGGRVPKSLKRRLEMLNAGGVAGRLTGKNLKVSNPTTFKPLGYLLNRSGKPVNISNYALKRKKIKRGAPIILVLGSGMDAGKTTTATSIIKALALYGKKVAAGKLTGTSRMKDISLMRDAGATLILDHVDAGFPSTHRCEKGELKNIFEIIYSNLVQKRPDYVVLEIADGIFQRETNILLRQGYLMEKVSDIFFSASDPVAAFGAKEYLESINIHLSAFSGPVANSDLMMEEVNKRTGISCVNPQIGSLEEIYNIITS
jgi:hypothetical protein